jgi:hypothetical protein
VALRAQTAVQDDFESGYPAPGWDYNTGAVVAGGGGANGSSHYASVPAGKDLGAAFTDVAPAGAKDFTLEFHFRPTGTGGRLFNLQVSTSTAPMGHSYATVNLRYEGGAFSAYNTAWQSIAGLGTLETGSWYRLRFTGREWGTPGARYGIELSEAGGTAFTRSSSTGLTVFQYDPPTSDGVTARYFVFSAFYGSSPGYDIDDVTATVEAGGEEPEPGPVVNISGVYPHLAVFSPEGEIGIGAVMPWADRLWFVTYPPHKAAGSSDKLWMVDSNLTLSAYAESVGCTDANRLVHRETQQLNIGHYLIASNGAVNVLPVGTLKGRLTASARHLTDPANKIYIATMEEGLYEVDVGTRAVTELYHDMNTAPSGEQKAAALPGVHGKGLYASQGRLFYSNNGSGGSLSAWDGTSWTTVERNKFTEITGPGGVYGNEPGDDRLWSLGWDARAVILRLYQNGVWSRYLLPKGSYTHDADAGWYTEWPRIREVRPGLMLMHMHGLFYRFPKTFSVSDTGGLDPICTYLKMPVDYCWWNGRLAMGRDDASTTGGNIWAGQSHSAPWFGQVEDMERWGPPAGFGGPWLDDAVAADAASAPFWVGGFRDRILHVKHGGASPVDFAVEVDPDGGGAWSLCTHLAVAANGYAWLSLPSSLVAAWVRLKPSASAANVTAYFHLANPRRRPEPGLFQGLACAGASGACSDGILRPKSGDARTLQFAVNRYDGSGALSEQAYYEIDGRFQLRPVTNAAAEAALRTTYGLAAADFAVDAASVVITEGSNRFRLPKGHPAYDAAGAGGWPRGRREVVTERQLFNAHGTFYELPLSDSGGFRRIRPVCTHNRRISDYASWRGLLVLAGVADGASADGHVFASVDGKAALWFGDVDDLWRMGEPRGFGGPWQRTAVPVGAASDPYLMFGYGRKELRLSHGNGTPVTFTVEVDVAADNTWSPYGSFTVPPGETVRHLFPDGYSAHWVRLKAASACTATAQFAYGPIPPTLLTLQ